MRLICLLIGHKWSDWKYIKTIGRYDERLDRTCDRCKTIETYIGPTEFDEFGRKIPYEKCQKK